MTDRAGWPILPPLALFRTLSCQVRSRYTDPLCHFRVTIESSGQNSVAILVITLADGRTIRHALGEGAEVTGRDAGCDIPLDDPSTSRRHARFSPTPNGYRVEDLGSKNGTLVNDRPTTSKLLVDGDSVQVGSTVIVYQESSAAAGGSVVVADDQTESGAARFLSRETRILLPQKRLELIYELSARLTTLQSQEQLLETVMDICFETLRFERGAVAIRPSSGSRKLDWHVVRNLRGSEGEITISRSLLSRALEHGERAIFTDEGLGKADPTVSMVQHGIRSAMCVPLVHQDEILGVIYGDCVSSAATYTDEDIDFLAGLAHHVSIGLINHRLVEDQKKMVRLNLDIELARKIQTGLFPADLPDTPELKIAAVNDPGQGISGDYYDVLRHDDDRIWCLMADVTGEGVAAALLMANLQAAVHVSYADTDDPGELLKRWNTLIYANTDSSKFITALLAIINTKTHVVRFASAGHHLPLILRASQDAPEELSAEPAFPLGVVEDAEFPTATADLGPAPFTFCCYTDGVIEAMNPDNEMFGEERLLDTLSKQKMENPRSIVQQVRKAVESFAAGARQSDDITIMAAYVG